MDLLDKPTSKNDYPTECTFNIYLNTWRVLQDILKRTKESTAKTITPNPCVSSKSR